MNNWFLLAAIPVFGICVLVHEFGHFITAKWAGIRVGKMGWHSCRGIRSRFPTSHCRFSQA